MSNNGWCTIESDPGVFSELLTSFGVTNAQVDEIYSLDEGDSDQASVPGVSVSMQKSFGLIFLFKYVQEEDSRETCPMDDVPDVFFAKQVVQNACASQAVLSVVLNADGIEYGPDLKAFKEYCQSLDYENKGYCIGDSEFIRSSHNSFAPKNAFELDSRPKSRYSKEDAYHFIAYVPINGIVFELDGLKQGPIIVGACASADSSDWMTVAKPVIEERMNRYSSSETSFALLNVCPRKIDLYDIALTNCVDESQIEMLIELRSAEESKLFRQAEENKRRRHDYTPLIINLLRVLSENGKLDAMVAAGKRKSAESAVATRSKQLK
jgi:ubiquitin carboxyl-terminal hydrolase L5